MKLLDSGDILKTQFFCSQRHIGIHLLIFHMYTLVRTIASDVHVDSQDIDINTSIHLTSGNDWCIFLA